MSKSGQEIATQVSKKYINYHVGQINTNRFTHNTFIEALAQFEGKHVLQITDLGKSEKGRVIKSITFGHGKTKVLLWSQMHGNESTATRAILDIVNFLTADDEFNSFREQIATKLTLQFVPMLNPDGTNRFQRRTATEIDMNRDAVSQETPEAQLLFKEVEDFKPQFAFNLHDQRRFYNVQNSQVPSSMSFLAPAYNQAREVNDTRKKAMQLIAGMNRTLQKYISGGVGLYNDTYSYRSFGDNIQTKGVSTILIESGWLAHDMEKEAIRKLNFTTLLSAFQMLADNSYNKFSEKDYTSIPPIDTKLFDLLIKGTNMGESNLLADIGINRTEHLLEHPNYYTKAKIDDIGDLSTFFGFETIDAKGLTLAPGKTVAIDNLEEISVVSVKRLLRQGVLFIITEDIPFENHVPFPINIVHPRKLKMSQEVKFDEHANFLLVDSKNKIKYIILNGFAMKPNQISISINGLVLV